MDMNQYGQNPPTLGAPIQKQASLDQAAHMVLNSVENVAARLNETLARLDGQGIKASPEQSRPEMPIGVRLQVSYDIMGKVDQMINMLNGKLFG